MAPVTLEGPADLRYYENLVQFGFQGHIMDLAGNNARYQASLYLYRNRKADDMGPALDIKQVNK
jgi:hypothetical protein